MFELKLLSREIDNLELQNSMIKACYDGDLNRVKRLFSEKVALNIVTKGSQFTLMHYAAKGGHTKVALWLLENNAPFLLGDKALGRTPLHLACEIGNKTIIGALLSRGARINDIDNKGCAPLHLACCSNDYKTPEFRAWLALRLFAAGADPRVENSVGYKPADYLDEAGLKSYQAGPLPHFPRDVWVKILEYLPKEEFYTKVMLTCKALYNVSILTLKNNFYKI